MKATVESIGKVGSQVRIGNHTLTFDQPAEVPGGEGRGPSPLDVMVASVAACAHYFASAFLYGRGLPTDGLTVDVTSTKATTPVPRVEHLTLAVRVPVPLTDTQRVGIERAIRRCPAYGTLTQALTIDLTLDIAAAPAAERKSA